jgi:putative protein-disulfide isomerase
MKPMVIYCYDAYCGWCYGFSSVISKLWSEYKRELDFEVLSGGMILTPKPVHVGLIASHVLNTYKQIENLTGAKFGEDYLWHIRNPDKSDWYPDSEKPAIALSILKEYYPDQQVQVALDIEYALFAEGRDLCDDEAYRHLLDRYDVPSTEFYEKLNSDQYREKAYEEFSLVKQLKVTGYPAILLGVTEKKYYLLSSGYTDYETLVTRIRSVLETAASPPQ